MSKELYLVDMAYKIAKNCQKSPNLPKEKRRALDLEIDLIHAFSPKSIVEFKSHFKSAVSST